MNQFSSYYNAVNEYAADSSDSSNNRPFVFLMILLCGIIVMIWISNSDKKFNEENYRTKETSLISEQSPVEVNNDTLWNALRQVTVRMRTDEDVDNNGKSNCVDFSIIFYDIMPRGSTKIIVNSGLNHCFNHVFIGGVWLAVEPQAHYIRSNTSKMVNIWGTEYDSSLDRDETRYYSRWAKK